MATDVAETQLRERVRVPSKRKIEHRMRSTPKDAKLKRPGNVKSHKKVKKLREKRKAMERYSDVEDEEEERRGEARSSEEDGEGDESDAHGEVEEGQQEGNPGSGEFEQEGGEERMQTGVTKFTHGCRAFKMAFTKIMKKSAQADALLVSCFDYSGSFDSTLFFCVSVEHYGSFVCLSLGFPGSYSVGTQEACREEARRRGRATESEGGGKEGEALGMLICFFFVFSPYGRAFHLFRKGVSHFTYQLNF